MGKGTNVKKILDAVSKLMASEDIPTDTKDAFDIKDEVKRILEEFVAQQWGQWPGLAETFLFDYMPIPMSITDFTMLLEYAGLAKLVVKSNGDIGLAKPDNSPLGFCIGRVPLFNDILEEWHFYDCLITSENPMVLDLLRAMHQALWRDCDMED